MYCIISVSFSTKCHLFSFFQIILSSCLSHELKFKYPPESVEVQDIMEVTFQQINIQFFTCLLPGRKMLPQSGSDSRRGWTCCCCWVVLGVIGIYATEVFFFVCVFNERSQSEYGELPTTFTTGARKNMVTCILDKEQSVDLSSWDLWMDPPDSAPRRTRDAHHTNRWINAASIY